MRLSQPNSSSVMKLDTNKFCCQNLSSNTNPSSEESEVTSTDLDQFMLLLREKILQTLSSAPKNSLSQITLQVGSFDAVEEPLSDTALLEAMMIKELASLFMKGKTDLSALDVVSGGM